MLAAAAAAAKLVFFVIYVHFALLHCVQKKTPTHVFDYISGISWSISYNSCCYINGSMEAGIKLLDDILI